MKPQPNEGRRITLGADGVYRWEYKVPLLKDLSVFWLIWRLFAAIFAVLFIIVNLADAISWKQTFREHFVDNLRFLGYFFVGMTVVVALGYLLYAAIMGGYYVVEFEMDETGIAHKQIAAQAQKAKRIGRATVMAGLATGRLTTVGVGMNAARTEMHSAFEAVRKIKAYPRRCLIKVNERFSHNRVYVPAQDFAFVSDYIRTRCVNVSKRRLP